MKRRLLIPTLLLLAVALPMAGAQSPATGDSAAKVRVQAGDTLSGIAKRFGLSANALARFNPGIDPMRLRVGQEIRIPGEANGAMLRIGVDYDSLRDAAMQYPAAVPVFLAQRCTHTMDGAAGEEYSEDLGRVLRTHGDEVMAGALRHFSKEAQQELVGELLFDAGVADGSPKRSKAMAEFKSKYPKTAAMASPLDVR